MAASTTTLWRPVGAKELQLIQESGRFPPRLLGQPIFYPVLNFEYAAKIASEWNVRDPASDCIGHVVRFEVETAFLSEFAIQTVGMAWAQEYWIPADRLEEFNGAIVGKIELVATYE